jgi:hypothetical protein
MLCAGRHFRTFAFVASVILGGLEFAPDYGNLLVPAPVRATSSIKKLQKKLVKKAKKTRKTLKKGEKKVARATKPVIAGALKVGAVLVLGTAAAALGGQTDFDPSDKAEEDFCPAHLGTRRQIERPRGTNHAVPTRPAAPSPPAPPTHHRIPSKP